MRYAAGFFLALIVFAGCTDGSASTAASSVTVLAARAKQDSVNRTLPGYVIDSIRPVEEELRRFRAAVGGDTVLRLRGVATRESLVRDFVSAVNAADTVTLNRLALGPREFSDLVYPESPYTRAPFHQAPGLVWMQLEAAGTTGLARLLRRMDRETLIYLRHRCPGPPDIQGANRIWTGCSIAVRNQGGDTLSARLFGAILERGGQFKFVNYANDY